MDTLDAKKAHQQVIKPTSKRFVVLFLYCLTTANKTFQWVQISACTEKLAHYYGVDNYVINASSALFLLAFVLISAPACCAIDRIGLRGAILVGSFSTAVGSVVKLLGYQRSGIYRLFVGQILVSLGEQFTFSLPSRLASVWFPDHQVSSATSFSVAGQELGVALGFLATQWMMGGANTVELVELALLRLFSATALLSTLTFLLNLWLFDEAPKEAPGAARLKQIREEAAETAANPRQGFCAEMRLLWAQVCKLMADANVCLLVLSYGISVAVSYALQTILSQILEPLWPDDDRLVGDCGFVMVIFGLLSLPMVGALMDKLHKYLLINILLTLSTIGALLLFAYAIVGLQLTWAIYLAAALVGFFQAAQVSAGLELAVELTYPAPELVTSSLMNVTPNLLGTLMVFAASFVVDTYGVLALAGLFVGSLSVALVLLLCTRETLRRQSAVSEEHQDKSGQLPNL